MVRKWSRLLPERSPCFLRQQKRVIKCKWFAPYTSVHLRLDSEAFEWFKKQGEGHLTRMNAVLRSYVNAQKD